MGSPTRRPRKERVELDQPGVDVPRPRVLGEDPEHVAPVAGAEAQQTEAAGGRSFEGGPDEPLDDR